tara:strand:+ start:282 stop:962 length:681 start_codon:yes stop_codon:yes gene_type:complete
MKEITKRILTAIFLLILLILAFFYSFILIISLIIISIVAWIEFNSLISKIFVREKINSNLLITSLKALSLLYLFIFSGLIFEGLNQFEFKIKLNIIYLISICICSDIGGFVFGKFFKGKKLTKISPNKTISGSLGSFVLPLVLIPIFYYILSENFNNFIDLTILSIGVSFFSQIGDLFISYLKRRANVKDTGDLLPGHGGILDRIDGILLAVPLGLILWKFLTMVS